MVMPTNTRVIPCRYSASEKIDWLRNASAITSTEVAANPVVVEPVAVGTRAEGHAAGARGTCREQFIALGGVRRDRIVVNVDVHVEAVRQLGIVDVAVLARTRNGIDRTRQISIRVFSLANRDAAPQSALVVGDAVVGDFQVVRPAVDEDAATALGAIGHRQAINARGVAVEAAWVPIPVVSIRIGPTSAIVSVGAVCKEHGTVGESFGSERLRIVREP